MYVILPYKQMHIHCLNEVTIRQKSMVLYFNNTITDLNNKIVLAPPFSHLSNSTCVGVMYTYSIVPIITTSRRWPSDKV